MKISFGSFTSYPTKTQYLQRMYDEHRLWYAIAYQQDPAKRGPGFGIAFLAIAGMWAGGLWAVIQLLTN
jgi:hypothetical protein